MLKFYQNNIHPIYEGASNHFVNPRFGLCEHTKGTFTHTKAQNRVIKVLKKLPNPNPDYPRFQASTQDNPGIWIVQYTPVGYVSE